MSELLSPAGTKEAFYAAISNGANAIYLGLDKYSARAYANNFNIDSLKELLDFAHLRNVRIFVTINTIVYDDELNEVYQTIDQLAELGVDAIIVQDLAVANYIINHYKSLEAHASTQMGIDDMEAARLIKDFGFTRIVFARETTLETIKAIKNSLHIEVEAFIHGALCVSYSGNCYMSSSIGERSGNRGRCAGCCRKLYSLYNSDTNTRIETGYLLSMKDLNVSNYIKDMSFVDSLKIEGRMKEPNYVASVTNAYRKIIDHEPIDSFNLNKVFNRTYTKGFMNHETSVDITNIEKPNNYGYFIGTIAKQNKSTIWIRLNKPLNKGDQIRIESDDRFKEISVPVLTLFDPDFKKIESTDKMAVLTCEEKVSIGAKVYKTKDINFVNEANRTLLNKEYQKIPVNMEIMIHLNKPITLKVYYQNFKVFVKSDFLVEGATTCPTSEESIVKQLSKLNDTPYTLGHLDLLMDDNLFVPVKGINELRREAINKLSEQRIIRKVIKNNPKDIVPQKHDSHDPIITVSVKSKEQYEAAVNEGIEHIYFENVVRRNHTTYPDFEGEVLVGGLGGINHYKNKNIVVSDTSLNIVNHHSVAILSSLGVERITLSEEISKDRTKQLIDDYINEYHTHPNLELVVYGRSRIMHTLYCPLKRLGMCGKCKESTYCLKDDYAYFPIEFNDDCTINLLNSKITNIMDDIEDLTGINYYRLMFTSETKEEVSNIIKTLKNKLDSKEKSKTYNGNIHTKGHFVNNPLL